MGYVSKEGYERKREYADAKMAENAEVETLTEEQHEALTKLCSLRHEMHTSYDSIWSGNGAEKIEPLCEGTENSICYILEDAGLPALHTINPEDLPSADDYYYLLDEEERDEYIGYDEWEEQSGAKEECMEILESLNIKVEKYLRKIDDEHGTHYAPTGKSRVY